MGILFWHHGCADGRQGKIWTYIENIAQDTVYRHCHVYGTMSMAMYVDYYR